MAVRGFHDTVVKHQSAVELPLKRMVIYELGKEGGRAGETS